MPCPPAMGVAGGEGHAGWVNGCFIWVEAHAPLSRVPRRVVPATHAAHESSAVLTRHAMRY